MKKVAIISLYHNSQNYGGVLQAFALNQAIEKFGLDAYQIDYVPDVKSGDKSEAASKYLKKHGLFRLMSKTARSLGKGIYSKISYRHLKGEFRKRSKVFKDFRENRIKHTAPCTSETIQSLTVDFDGYICGSDQIWKPTVVNDAYMLSFVNREKIKFSYAASLSVDTLSEDEKFKYSIWLRDYKGISVRERQAVDLLSPLTDIPVQWVCDPTLLLTKKEWLSHCAAYEQCEDKPYMFCYFLGDDSIHRKMATDYAKKNNLRIVTIPNLQKQPRAVDARFGDDRLYDVSPLDFVSLISGAEIVFTDSFHAVAFSLNLETPFFVFERGAITSMNSRIESLLSMTKCEDRFIREYSYLELSNKASIVWDEVNSALDAQREYSFNFLKQCLCL